MRGKIRALLHGAVMAQCQACVFSAFGCGAFGNPPEEVARLFKEEMCKVDLRWVTFCILNDHNAHRRHNPRGNFVPFQEAFQNWKIWNNLKRLEFLHWSSLKTANVRHCKNRRGGKSQRWWPIPVKPSCCLSFEMPCLRKVLISHSWNWKSESPIFIFWMRKVHHKASLQYFLIHQFSHTFLLATNLAFSTRHFLPLLSHITFNFTLAPKCNINIHSATEGVLWPVWRANPTAQALFQVPTFWCKMGFKIWTISSLIAKVSYLSTLKFRLSFSLRFLLSAWWDTFSQDPKLQTAEALQQMASMRRRYVWRLQIMLIKKKFQLALEEESPSIKQFWFSSCLGRSDAT